MPEEITDTVDETVDAPIEEQPLAEAEDVGALKRAYERTKEESRQAREELRRIREDESARADLLKEWGYELDDASSDEDDDDYEDDESPAEIRDPRVDGLLKDIERKEIRADLDRINSESGWDFDDHDRTVIEAWARQAAAEQKKGFSRGHLEKAHQQYVERLEGYANRGVERAASKPTKPAPPHVPAGGKAATETKNILDMSPDQHRAWAREQYKARMQGG